MFNRSKPTLVIALFLMTFLCLGTMAQARNTHGSDKLKKGAVIGAVVGLGTQAVRGNRAPGQLVKGAALGGLIGAGVGSYVDYKEERKARRDDGRYYDRGYNNRGYDRGYDRGYYRGDNYNRRYARDDYRPRNNRARAHRHNQRCHH
jgi:uncharacterized protein YcfJ